MVLGYKLWTHNKLWQSSSWCVSHCSYSPSCLYCIRPWFQTGIQTLVVVVFCGTEGCLGNLEIKDILGWKKNSAASGFSVMEVTRGTNNSQNMPVSTFSLVSRMLTPTFSIAARAARLHYNDVWTLLPRFPLFTRTHLVKPGAADRTAGLLMIAFSRCPIVLYPLTFPSEESSRWTATAPSEMPFLLLLIPPSALLETQTDSSIEGRK